MELAALIGENARAHRRASGATLDEVAQQARQLGLKWTSSRAGDFESGRVAATVATLVAAAGAYSMACGSVLTVRDMLAGEGIEITGRLTATGEWLADVLAGGDPRPRAGQLYSTQEIDQLVRRGLDKLVSALSDVTDHGFGDVPAADLHAVESNAGLATDRVAADLGVPVMVINAAAARLWHRSVEDERDRRAGEGASAQKRGHVMRALKDELRQTITGGSDG